MTTASVIIDCAKKWLGTPYHHQGRVIGAGVDCATLLCEVYHDSGLIPYIDPRPYAPDWHLHQSGERYLGWLEQYSTEVDSPSPGDVIAWRFGRCYSHAAIFIGGTTIIHSYIKQGCVYADINDPVFDNRPLVIFSILGKRNGR